MAAHTTGTIKYLSTLKLKKIRIKNNPNNKTFCNVGANVGKEFSDFLITVSPILTEKKAPENESLLSYGEYLSGNFGLKLTMKYKINEICG